MRIAVVTGNPKPASRTHGVALAVADALAAALTDPADLTDPAVPPHPPQVVVDLAEPGPDLTGLDSARHLSSEADGLRQRLAFDAEETTAAKVLAAVSDKAEVVDLTVEEPDIEGRHH